MSILSTNDPLLDQAAERLRIMGHPMRLLLVAMLKAKPQHVGELAERLGESLAVVSYHLRAMERCGLVASSREGRFVTYTVDVEMASQVCSAVCQHLEAASAASPEARARWLSHRKQLES